MTQYIAVITKMNTREQVEAYLYGGNDIVSWETGKSGTSYAVVEAKATHGFAAQYQADRLASGLIGARVYDERKDAILNLQEMAEHFGDYTPEGDEENPDDHPLAGSPV